jgi:uroporphyrin-3 C-methyltransferase
MSQNDKNDKNESAAGDDDTTTTADEQHAPRDAATGAREGAPASIAWLAFFLSLVAAAGVGYLVVETRGGDDVAAEASASVASMDGRLAEIREQTTESVDDLRSGLDDLRSLIGELTAADSRAITRIDSLRQDLEARTDLFDTLPSRISSVERSLAALKGVSVDLRNTYLLAEAEYYLQIANTQLELGRNPTLAARALEQADDRLLNLADPGLTDVRREIADEIAALEAVETTDIEGLAITLASLSRVVESLPMKPTSEEELAREQQEAAGEGGAKRALNAVREAVSGLVKVTPPSAEDAPLLMPEAEPLIRSNLALQLQAARLALLRREQTIFEQSLDDAKSWLETYFRTSSEPVSSALETIDEARASYSTATLPDISGSLRLLREYQAMVESRE